MSLVYFLIHKELKTSQKCASIRGDVTRLIFEPSLELWGKL